MIKWLRGRYELSFDTEDWLEWKHWFKIYRRFITYTIFGYTIGWFGGFFGWYTIGYIIGVFEVRFFGWIDPVHIDLLLKTPRQGTKRLGFVAQSQNYKSEPLKIFLPDNPYI